MMLCGMISQWVLHHCTVWQKPLINTWQGAVYHGFVFFLCESSCQWMLFHDITKEEKQQLLPRFTFSQYRVNLTLGSDFFFFTNASLLILLWAFSLFLFLIGILSTCSFSFSALYFPCFPSWKTLPIPFLGSLTVHCGALQPPGFFKYCRGASHK